ncbi:hypothetical protein ACOXXX_18155 [Thalassococcus sp. BH17M4-6]|uniref:hypothetical protein n=1 Tax=Thalassococcus sp. BH17M4-6 TaxID=3413148 RepID=UPI003BDBA3F7
MRPGIRQAALIVATLAGGTGMTTAMGQSPETWQVACTAEGPKTALPDGICAAFVARLAAAYPGARISEGTPADLTLVVETHDRYTFAARIDRGATRGELRGTARRGAPLDMAGRTQLLDRLIAELSD